MVAIQTASFMIKQNCLRHCLVPAVDLSKPKRELCSITRNKPNRVRPELHRGLFRLADANGAQWGAFLMLVFHGTWLRGLVAGRPVIRGILNQGKLGTPKCLANKRREIIHTPLHRQFQAALSYPSIFTASRQIRAAQCRAGWFARLAPVCGIDAAIPALPV
jgi:hypothetical protein